MNNLSCHVKFSLLVLHGPNLNLLGLREPDIYGQMRLDDINQQLQTAATKEGVGLQIYQSNHEGGLVERIHEAFNERIDGIIINPAAYTHTSVAILDALKAVNIPYIEVHLSNIYQREPYRRSSFFSEYAVGVISGFGAYGYKMGLCAMVNYLENSP